MKKMKVKKMITFKRKAMLVMSFIVSAFVMTVLANARLINVNPGENASTEMRIAWHTDVGVSGSFVEYTKRTDVSWANARRVVGEYEVSSTWNGVTTIMRIGGVNTDIVQDFDVNRYRAVLSNLTPGTDYMFRVGIGNNLSETRFFRTAGTGEFSFAWISDVHVYHPLPQRLVNGMNMVSTIIQQAPQGVDFILSTGDMVAFGGCHNAWEALFDHPHYRNYMWVTMVGNHDVYQARTVVTNPANHRLEFYTHTHNNPPNGYPGQEGASYWFKYNNVLWIILNCMDLQNAAQVPIAQAWAADVIRRNPAQYIFVAKHFQWFMASGAPNAVGFTRWGDFFDKWGVDVAFAGNTHVYVRTHSIYNGLVNTDPTRGTVYIVAPSADGDRGIAAPNLTTISPERIAFRWSEATATSGNSIGGSLVTVNENQVEVSLFNRHGVRQDHVVIPAKRRPFSETPPFVLHLTPEADVLSVRRPIEMTFSRRMNRTSVEQAISFSPAAPDVIFTWYNDYALSINIRSLQSETNYTLTINGSIAQSLDGEFLDGNHDGTPGGNFVMQFQTEYQDPVPPVVVSYGPQNEQEESVRPIVRIEFNKELDGATIAANQLTVTDASGNPVAGRQCFTTVNNRSVLHFIFDADLMPFETYTVTLKNDGIECIGGNLLAGGQQFTFTPRPRRTERALVLQSMTEITTPGWTRGGQTSQEVLAAHAVDANMRAAAESPGSMRLSYQWVEEMRPLPEIQQRRWRFHNNITHANSQRFVRAERGFIQFYMFGDGSHTRVTPFLQTTGITPNVFWGKQITMDWVGWKKITWDLSNTAGLSFPILGGSGPIPEMSEMSFRDFFIEAALGTNLAFTPSSFWISQVEALHIGNFIDFVVTFNSMGGSSVPMALLYDGDLIPLPVEPELDGYIFDGWFTCEYHLTEWDFNTGVVTSHLTLYAKWTAMPRFLVTFNSQGGTAVEPQNIIEGRRVTRPENPTFRGHSLAGWFTAGDVEWNFDVDVVTSALTLYARWDALPSFTVTFDTRGGSAISPVVVFEGETLTRPADPTREEHVFIGWFTGDDVEWNFDDYIVSNLTLYAEWRSRPDNFPHPEQCLTVTAQDFYDFYYHGSLDAPWLNENNIRRAIHRNGQLYVLTHAPNPRIFIVNPATLELVREMDLTGISGGWDGLTISDIAFTSDGKLLACNMDIVFFTGAAAVPINPDGAFKVYIWDNDDAQPRLLFQITDGAGGTAGNWNNGRIGDAMAVSGPSWDVTIYVSAASAVAPHAMRIVAFTKEEGRPVAHTRRHFVTANAAQNSIAAWGEDFQFSISPRGEDRFIVTSSTVNPFEVRFDWAAGNASTTLASTPFAAECGFSLTGKKGINFFRYAGQVYMAAPIAGQTTGVAMFDITDGFNSAVKISDVLISETAAAGIAPFSTSYAMAFGVVRNEHIYLSVLAGNQGFSTFATYPFDDGTTGIETPNQQLNVRVFPNPVENILNIDADFEITSLRLVDLTGRLIMNIPANQRTVDMSGVQTGHYILFVNDIPVRIIKR